MSKMDTSRSTDGDDTFIPTSILVTGGCGFIGSNFINHIAKVWTKATIVNYDKLMPGANACNVIKPVRDSDRYHLVIGDQLNDKLLAKVFETFEIDLVVNFAANSHVDDCYQDPVAATQNNVLGMTHFIEACIKYGKLTKFLHISSDEVYGDSELGDSAIPKREDTLLTPTNPYAATKAGCEAILNAYRVSYNLPVVITRMNNVYGPRQWDTKVVPRFIGCAQKGEPFTIMGDGEQLRSWMFVDDCCNGIRLLCERAKVAQIYNLGTHFELSIKELGRRIHAEVTTQTLPMPVAPFDTVPIPDRPYNDRRYYIDTSKIEREIGWKCVVPFEEGLRRTVAWYMLPHHDVMSEKLLVYGARGWIGSQFVKMLQRNEVCYVEAKQRPGADTDELVEKEIIEVAPSHVVCLIGRTHGPGKNNIEFLEGGPDKLKINMQDNLYGPWLLATISNKLGIHMTYLGTGCLFQYNNEHCIGGKGYSEEDEPNYFGNSYSVVKGYCDRLMHHFDNVFNARIRLPVNFSNDSRNLVVKVASYKKIYDVPNSITILPDILPIVLDLIKKRFIGTLNMTNPGPLKHSQTLKIYSELVESREWEIIDDQSAEGKTMSSNRSNCTLDTSKLEQMYPDLRCAMDGIKEAVLQVALSSGQVEIEKLRQHGFRPRGEW